MDKPLHFGFAVLELSNMLMYESCYDKLQSFLREKNIQLHYMDTDTFVSKINTNNVINDFSNIKFLFYFSNINKNHELYKIKKGKVVGEFRIETPKNTFLESFSLGSKAYSFECGSDKKNKLKGISNLKKF